MSVWIERSADNQTFIENEKCPFDAAMLCIKTGREQQKTMLKDFSFGVVFTCHTDRKLVKEWRM